MVNTSPTITEPTVRELSTLLKYLRTQEAALKAELATLGDRIGVIEKALQIMHDLSGVATTATDTDAEQRTIVLTDNLDVPSDASIMEFMHELQKMKQIDALRLIAVQNGGTIRTADAKRIFLEAGLAKGAPKNVAPHIYHMLQAAEDFERVAPGTFQIIDEANRAQISTVAQFHNVEE